MEFILGILAVMGGAILMLLKKNKKLESDKTLSDIKVKDATLETEQSNLKKDKEELKKELVAIEKEVQPELSDSEIEKFWGDYKK
jgi:hypothetical protein